MTTQSLVQPTVQKVRSGWLAATPPGYFLRFGVQADTWEDAVSAFEESLTWWTTHHAAARTSEVDAEAL